MYRMCKGDMIQERQQGCMLTWFLTLLTCSFSMLRAPMSMLLEMLSRWPRYFSQGPAMLMWSVVHLPFTLIRIRASCIHRPQDNSSHTLHGMPCTITKIPTRHPRHSATSRDAADH